MSISHNDNWPRPNWRLRFIVTTVLVLGYGGSGWFAFTYGMAVKTAALADKVDPSTATILGIIPTAVLTGIGIAFTLCAALWISASDNRLAYWLRGE